MDVAARPLHSAHLPPSPHPLISTLPSNSPCLVAKLRTVPLPRIGHTPLSEALLFLPRGDVLSVCSGDDGSCLCRVEATAAFINPRRLESENSGFLAWRQGMKASQGFLTEGVLAEGVVGPGTKEVRHNLLSRINLESWPTVTSLGWVVVLLLLSLRR